jgi:adiponectin receptor
MFAGFGLAILFPFSHLLINESLYGNYGDTFEFSGSLPYHILLGASYAGGLYTYTVKCPERHNPGKYNLCGHSHQIWHGMVVLGVFFTYLGAL